MNDAEMSPIAESLTLDLETSAVQNTMRAKRWPAMRDVWQNAAERDAADAGLYSRRRVSA